METEWQRTGRRILIDVAILRPDPITDLTSITVPALLDTGATTSGVARHIADELRLPSIGKLPVTTAGGIIMSERYLMRLAIPQPPGLPFIFDDITGFELIDHIMFQAVLGMDVLSRCDFEMRRDGRCILRAT